MTNDLIRRVHEHMSGYVKGFTNKYDVDKLVYFRQCENFESALQREKRLKEWKRKWKLELIEKVNPLREDLFGELVSDR